MTLTRRGFVAGGWAVAAGTEEGRAKELLGMVAARYRQARAVRVAAVVRVAAGVSGGNNPIGSYRTTERAHSLLCVGGRSRLDSGEAKGKVVQHLVDDGEVFLYASSHRRAYFVGESGSEELRMTQAELEKWKFHLVTRFGRVDELDVERRWRGPGRVTTKRGRVDCEVVELKERSKQLGWTEQLWIEAETGLVWRSGKVWTSSRESLPGRTTVEVQEYEWPAEVGPEAFVTTPPEGYERLERAPWLMGPEGR